MHAADRISPILLHLRYPLAWPPALRHAFDTSPQYHPPVASLWIKRNRAQPPGLRSLAGYALPLALGLLLRLFFIHHDPDLSGDPLIYGAIARNLLQHGVYSFSAPGAPLVPTLIRLPGYPFFLAACFQLFGVEHYDPILYLQAVIDLCGCLLLAMLAARLIGPSRPSVQRRAALITLWLSALCPFTACYTAAPLTETLELFSIATALYAFTRGLSLGEPARTLPPSLRPGWLAMATLAWTLAALLRPDGALLGLVLCPAIALYGLCTGLRTPGAKRTLQASALCAVATLLAFTPWAVRNWHTFRVFQPLAPRYATDPGEPIHPGFQRWTKTLCTDLTCTAEVYWAADDRPIGLGSLPSRAFDSPQQLRTTADLLRDYNRATTITPALDARFATLAAQRIADHPARFYLGLPVLRLTDMLFRPRSELFNIDLRWWRYKREGPDTILAWAFATLNFVYFALAVAGAIRCFRHPAVLSPLLLGVVFAFILLRCALLLTLEAPEPRYTLELYPVVFLLGSLWLATYKEPALFRNRS